MRARLALSVSQRSCFLREIALRDRPQQLYDASPKGTVPVLVLQDGTVIDESLAIMRWALQQHDPEGWSGDAEQTKQMLGLIAENDGDFKFHLDRYKYATRYEGVVAEEHRDQAAQFLMRLEHRMQDHDFLFGERPMLADMAIAPFVRQFSIADSDWFQQQEWQRLIAWLQAFLESRRFLSIMTKHPVWQAGQEGLRTDWPIA
jgi:glutathione S-transferase